MTVGAAHGWSGSLHRTSLCRLENPLAALTNGPVVSTTPLCTLIAMQNPASPGLPQFNLSIHLGHFHPVSSKI